MTPTCRTCGSKFPGKDTCKTCGCDPNAVPSVAQRLVRSLGMRPGKPITKKDRSAAKAAKRSITRGPIGRPKLKHGRQVKTRG